MESCKKIFALGLFLVVLDICSAGITVDQMKSTSKMVRDVCQPKFKISDDVGNGIGDGVFPEEKSVKCYVNCIMEMMQISKKGKFLYESALKQIDILLPAELVPQYKVGFETCRHSSDGIKDHCEAAYTLLKCLKNNVAEFMFP